MKASYSQAQAYIDGIPMFAGKRKASDTEELLRRLSHPEESFRVVHVAGTNGKGSVCAFLESIFREAGWRTGLFISPHLVRVNERFQVNRDPISDEAFADAFCHVKDAVDSMEKDGYPHPSYFEFLFVMGMWYFRSRNVELAVCETGLGGRLDATNTIRHPSLSVITSIGYDHMQYLGDTLEEIAAEKAGILKAGVPVVYDANCPKAEAVIQRRADALRCPQTSWKKEMSTRTAIGRDSVSFTLEYPGWEKEQVIVPIGAEYQVDNASLAVLSAEAWMRERQDLDAKHPLSRRIILDGIAKTGWEARMEEVLKDVFVDGAHNENAVIRLHESLLRIAKERRISLLYSSVADKNWEKMIPLLCDGIHFQKIVTTSVSGSRQVDAGTLAQAFSGYTEGTVYAEPDPRRAFQKALSMQGDSVLVCCGSLYLAGEIKSCVEESGHAEL